MSPPTLFGTVEEAIAEGKKLFTIFDEHDNPTNRFENFIVIEVRPAVLGDFFHFPTLIGDIRERMAQTCGDDSSLDGVDRGEVDGDGNAILVSVLQDGELETALIELLNQYGEERMDLSGLTIEVARRGVTDISSL